MEQFKIQNVFVNFSLGVSIDIEALSREFPNAIYDPELSPPLEIKDEESESVFRVFQSGQVTCLGGKSVEKVKISVKNFLEILKDKKFIPSTDVDIKICNYVATLNIGRKIRLWKAAYFLEGARYDPQHLPWLTYGLQKPKVIFHMFENGNIVCTGARNRREINSAFKALRVKLEENSLLL